MNPDEPGAILMLVNEQRTFIDQNDHTWCVLHKTASGGTAQDIATFFANDPAMASTHYIVGQDGTIVQCVLEKDGAGGNCCLETGHAAFLPLGVNLNVKTVSIEHCDPAPDNSTPLTDAQKAASFRLVRDICQRHNIPMRKGDASGGIIGHCDIAPLSRARCPGNYPMAELFTFLKGGFMLPPGWTDDGTTLTGPNGIHIVLGFRGYVLPRLQSGAWDAGNMALAPQYYTQLLEASNPALGDGDQIVFLYGDMLAYPHNPQAPYESMKNTVIREWTGKELAYTRGQLATYYNEYKVAQAAIALLQPEMGKLKQEVATLQAQVQADTARLDPATVKDRLTAIGLASNNYNAAVQQLVTQPLS